MPCTLYPIPYSLYPIPYTLYPIPYTLYPIPYTLYLIPCTLYPIPHTLYPMPYTLYLTPYTLYPTLHTLNLHPAPCALNPKLKPLNRSHIGRVAPLSGVASGEVCRVAAARLRALVQRAGLHWGLGGAGQPVGRLQHQRVRGARGVRPGGRRSNRRGGELHHLFQWHQELLPRVAISSYQPGAQGRAQPRSRRSANHITRRRRGYRPRVESRGVLAPTRTHDPHELIDH